jgi:hypothetical protein
MESIRNILGKAGQSEESTEAKQLSVKPSSVSNESTRQVSILLEQMAAGFPSQEVPPETAEMWTMAFGDLAVEYGVEQVRKALRVLVTRQKFFPHPAEVAEVLEEMAKKQQAELRKQLPKVGCELCRDSVVPGHTIVLDDAGYRAVRECGCLLAYRAAKQALLARAR